MAVNNNGQGKPDEEYELHTDPAQACPWTTVNQPRASSMAATSKEDAREVAKLHSRGCIAWANIKGKTQQGRTPGQKRAQHCTN
eukprot:1155302-Pelagomonas_calceolata.AAC.5